MQDEREHWAKAKRAASKAFDKELYQEKISALDKKVAKIFKLYPGKHWRYMYK